MYWLYALILLAKTLQPSPCLETLCAGLPGSRTDVLLARPQFRKHCPQRQHRSEDSRQQPAVTVTPLALGKFPVAPNPTTIIREFVASFQHWTVSRPETRWELHRMEGAERADVSTWTLNVDLQYSLNSQAFLPLGLGTRSCSRKLPGAATTGTAW